MEHLDLSDKPSTQRTVYFESCRGVFQGGGCRAAALAGALEAAHQRGVNFTAVAGTSAGAIIAALVGAGADAAFVLKHLRRLDFKTLLNPPIVQDRAEPFGSAFWPALLTASCRPTLVSAAKVLKWGGLYSSINIESWVEGLLKELLPHVFGPIQFAHLVLPTYIVGTDLPANKAKIWSTAESQSERVALAVRASCSIPFFFQPVTIGASRYVDGGILSNLPSFVFSDRDATILNSDPILAFLLQEDESVAPAWTVATLLKRLISAVIDGSTDLQLRMHRSVNTVSILTGDIKATDFDKVDDAEKQKLVTAGQDATHAFLNNERSKFVSSRQNTIPIRDQYELLHAVVLEFSNLPTEVLISARDARWVWNLYPTILSALVKGISLRVALPKIGQGVDPPESARRLLLRDMGVEFVEIEDIGEEAFAFIHSDSTRSSAIVAIDGNVELGDRATQYIGQSHITVIKHIYARLREMFAPIAVPGLTSRPDLKVCDELEFEKRLRVGVHQYRSAKIECAEVPIEGIDLSVKMIRSYKYRQIQELVKIFGSAGVELFSPAKVHYSTGATSLVTPPILERTGSRYFVIEGNTRIFYCYRFGIQRIKALVISDVSAPLPAGPIALRHVQLTSSHIDPKVRFSRLDYSNFRKIEAAIQQPKGL